MTGFVIHYRLQAGPADKLSASFGLLDAAEEHGLSMLVPDARGWRRLPQGVLWGPFLDGAQAIAAFDRALQGASELLGFTVQAERRLAIGFDDAESEECVGLRAEA
jgi:hypothetical protein